MMSHHLGHCTKRRACTHQGGHEPYDPIEADIWNLGVILYARLFVTGPVRAPTRFIWCIVSRIVSFSNCAFSAMSFATRSVSVTRNAPNRSTLNDSNRQFIFPSRRSGSNLRQRSRGGLITVQAETSQSTEYRWPEWSESWRFLTDSGMQTISPQRGLEMVQSGKWMLVDVRPKSSFEKCHPENSVNVPLFDSIDWSNATPMAYLRAAAYLVNGVSPVTINEDFDEQLSECLKDRKGLIFYCETGGTMTPSTNFMYGKQSRSLKACFRALKANPDVAVAHLDEGLLGWYKSGLPLIGEYDTSTAGRTPNIAKAPEIESENKN